MSRLDLILEGGGVVFGKIHLQNAFSTAVISNPLFVILVLEEWHPGRKYRSVVHKALIIISGIDIEMMPIVVMMYHI